MCVRVCVCVCVYVCVCVCVYERDKERERGREGGKEREINETFTKLKRWYLPVFVYSFIAALPSYFQQNQRNETKQNTFVLLLSTWTRNTDSKIQV